MLSVLIASGCGAVCRYLLEHFNRRDFPVMTLLVNVLGSFIAGLAISLESSLSIALVAFAGTFTTFSGLIAGTHVVSKTSKVNGFIYGHGSVVLSVVAAWIGLSIV